MSNSPIGLFANDICYLDWLTHVFCTGDIEFRAQIIGISNEPGSLLWYIDDIEQTNVRDSITWLKHFPIGDYHIRMKARLSDGVFITKESILHVGDEISTTPSPPEGGSIEGNRCYLMYDEAVLTAIPNVGYSFLNGLKIMLLFLQKQPLLLL